MNAHTPFDANQDWTNPYCRNSSNDPMVDALLGNAYHVVRTVYCNLGYIKHLYDFLSKYGVVICVQSEAELKTLTTEAKYARIYDKSPAGDRRVTDYLYVDDDRTGILPDDTTATGSWINVATSNSGDGSKDGGYIPWVYNSGSANGGETSIRIPDETAGAPFMIVNGDWQTEGYDFEYDPLTFEIKFTTPLEQGDFVVVMRTGIPATPDNPNVSDWVTINWLYNHGAAVGGEQVIDIPYTFQSVPAVYKNGLRFSKGLANNSYTIDPDNNRIILTEPLATNDRLVIQLGGEAKVLETVDHTIQEVARVSNVKDSEVILSTDTTQVLNGKKVVYSVSEQKAYGLPVLPTNVYIKSVADGKLTYNPGSVSVDLLDAPSQLRTQLSLRNGSERVGYNYGDTTYFADRSVSAALKNSLHFDDFKGSTDDEKFASLVSYQALLPVRAISVEFAARTYTFTTSPGTLTKPFNFIGSGRRSTILKFVDCDGIRADLSGYGSRYIQSRISDMSIVTTSEKSHTGVYFKGVQSYAPHDPALLMDHVSIFGLRDIDTSASSNTEWSIALHLDDADEVTLSDVYICGAPANASYATRTSSWGILANKVTSLILDTADIMLVGIGLEVNGQSEGLIGDGVTIVGVDYGMLFRNMVSPCNNHVLTNSHISAYTMGIEFRKNTEEAGDQPQSVYLSNIFLLEREGNANKPYYTAIQAYVARSCLDNITIQSNTATSPNRRGIIISNQDNMVSNVFGLNVGTLLNIDGVSSGYVYYNNVRCRGDLQNLLTGSTQFAIGAGLGAYANAADYDVRCATFRTTDAQGRSQYECSNGRHLFGGGRHNTSVYHDFRTLSGGTAAYDGRILFTGGSPSVAGQADAVIYAKNIAFAGNLASETANAFTCGTSGRPWAGGFTQTAFTITSDAACKTEPLQLSDKILDAAEEVQLVQYKYLDRIEEKGEDGARWHFGAIAQRYVEAFAKHGLDAHHFGFICYDEWDDTPAVVDDETGEVVAPAIKAGSRYGIRYEEMLVLEAAVQRRKVARLESRIESLETLLSEIATK